MDYNEWIKKQRRVRIKILGSSPVIQKEHIYSVCSDCGEMCLYHEEFYPNCNANSVLNQRIEMAEVDEIASRIRCQYRFSNLERNG